MKTSRAPTKNFNEELQPKGRAMSISTAMDHAPALDELLKGFGFCRYPLTRTRAGHWLQVAELADQTLDVLLDTGAASTVVDLGFCRERMIPIKDTGQFGGGAGGVHLAIFAVEGVQFCLGEIPLKSDGVYALDLSHANEALVGKGAEPVHAILGVDILTYHQAVIDYASGSLYLKPAQEG